VFADHLQDGGVQSTKILERLDGVPGIWTAIGPRFVERTGIPFSVDAAIHYLQSLAEPTKTMALGYIRNAPAEVVTPVRAKVQDIFA
jgi:hypothetical protein